MPDRPRPSALSARQDVEEERDELRQLTRSPHPYHRLNSDIPDAAHHFVYRTRSGSAASPSSTSAAPPPTTKSDEGSDPGSSPFPPFTKESTPASESGTEADDEHYLKGLPAPKVRLHKGLRVRNEHSSGTSSPVYSPGVLEEDEQAHHAKRGEERAQRTAPTNFWDDKNYRRTKELCRRALEFCISAALFAILRSNEAVRPMVVAWSRELSMLVGLIAFLMLLYPLRLLAWTYNQRQHHQREPSKPHPISIPPVFDPAPTLYPPFITILVSFLVAIDNPAVILPNIVLSISSIPKVLIPTAHSHELVNSIHWAMSCLPLYLDSSQSHFPELKATIPTNRPGIGPETAVLLYPLHQSLLWVLHYLTTTSLLTAELQLLSIGLIDLLLLAHSPQAIILRTLLWLGGVAVMLLCGPVIRWGIALARVPRLRFRRDVVSPRKSWFGLVKELLSPRRLRRDMARMPAEDTASETLDSDEEGANGSLRKPSRVRTFALGDSPSRQGDGLSRSSSVNTNAAASNGFALSKTSTFPNVSRPARSATHTFSGRKKRTSSTTVRSFFQFTETQAFVRRWAYSAHVHFFLVAIIIGPVRHYIGASALGGREAIGWALGYLFGDIPWFRLQVVSANLERWICLPAREDDPRASSCHLGWVQHIRHAEFGEANTRLFVGAYWLTAIVFGLVVVVRLDPKYEVDTRRKVFHFMMVAMFLPATYVDPVFAGLALSFALAIFLILDLVRASQLPPLSRPIASFLTPYVDGRDHKGPVVISHIFLLIGCAIPLWLTLATLPRTGETDTGPGTSTVTSTDVHSNADGESPLANWEVPTREVSMVAGVICVGLGDAAASLIGRRYGHKKWVWGGGKSLEGSVAFAAAVFVGLMAAATWLRIGGWAVSPGHDVSWTISARNGGICATMASLTEAVLTGGNDNVIVPVVLWTCVKSLGV